MKGKDKCNLLKGVRSQIAEQHGLQYTPSECHHDGDCSGTCPRCEEEMRDLEKQLKQKGVDSIGLDARLQQEVDNFNDHSSTDDEQFILQGDIEPPVNDADNDAMHKTHVLQGDIIEGMPMPESYYRIILECPIAGWSYKEIDEIWYSLHPGASLRLKRESFNAYDDNAIAVKLEEGNIPLGYVPKKYNYILAGIMDAGWDDLFSANISKIEHQGPINERLRMEISVPVKNEFSPITKRLYLWTVNSATLNKFTQELFNRGYSYQRWMYLPDWDVFYAPQKGDKIIVACRKKEVTLLYLMQVIADNGEVYHFLQHPEEETQRIDSCNPYILSTVMGPIQCPADALSFIENFEQFTLKPLGDLPPDMVEQFRKLFGVPRLL